MLIIEKGLLKGTRQGPKHKICLPWSMAQNLMQPDPRKIKFLKVGPYFSFLIKDCCVQASHHHHYHQ